MEKVIIVVGPTGVGKSDLGVQLAQFLSSEVIGGDSIQVYQGLDIGSGKIKASQMNQVKHHLIDIVPPSGSYTVKDFQEQARRTCEQLHQVGKIPIIVGGTGLYLKSFLYDYHFDHSSDVAAADVLRYEALSNEELYERLLQIDHEATLTIHPNNRKRVIRALAIYDKSGTSKSQWIAKQEKKPLYDAYIIGLTCERSLLYERINQRVDRMFEEGLVEEVTLLHNQGIEFGHQCMQGIGYKEFAPYFQGVCTLSEVKEKIKIQSRRFAKRQYTWFENQMEVQWYDRSHEDFFPLLMKNVMHWIET